MSEAHKHYIPIIAGHVDRIGYTFGQAEACLRRTGERADYWSMARRPVAEAIPEHPNCTRDGRRFADLDIGSSAVHELKLSVADLRADASKPWRKPGVRALGERRFIWLPAGGTVRPEHVEESNGWGVVVFDKHRYEIVRPSAFFPCLYRDEHELAIQIVEKRARNRLDGQVFAGPSAPAVPLPSHQKPNPDHFPGPTKKVPDHIRLAKDYLSAGPANTSALRRHLLNEHGIKIAAGKLTLDMKQSRLFSQDGPGGNWSLKEGVPHGARPYPVTAWLTQRRWYIKQPKLDAARHYIAIPSGMTAHEAIDRLYHDRREEIHATSFDLSGPRTAQQKQNQENPSKSQTS